MTSRLFGSNLSNLTSSPVRVEMEYCGSPNYCSYWVTDSSTTRKLSSSITGRHPHQYLPSLGKGTSPRQRCSRCILQPHPTGHQTKESLVIFFLILISLFEAMSVFIINTDKYFLLMTFFFNCTSLGLSINDKEESEHIRNNKGLVLWHINHCRLFNAKSFLYI